MNTYYQEPVFDSSSEPGSFFPSNQDLLTRWKQDTLEALSFSGFVSDAEKAKIDELFVAPEEPASRIPDILECLVKARQGADSDMAAMTEDLAYVASLYLSPPPILVPFAPSLTPPSAFYEKFPELHRMSRFLLTPIAYVEDNEVVGVCSLNAIAAEIAAEYISETLKQKIRSTPYVTVVRLDYNGWLRMLQSHFNYDRI